MNRDETIEYYLQIGQAFTPSAPINSSALFAGRRSQLGKVLNAISQRGQHAVIYGERGVGKTSLANVVFDFLKEKLGTIQFVKVNCEANTTFSTLWHNIFRSLSIQHQLPTPAGFTAHSDSTNIPAQAFLPTRVTPEDVRYMFERISRNTVIIIDEVDRIEGEETTKRLADTIKTLSDYAVATTLILVGVGDSVDDLIKEHLSVERALVQIQMPRMSPEELFEIIDKGVAIAKMTIDADARRQVVKLSEGLPHYTHLLGLHAAEAAIKKESTNITKEDVNKALDVALEQAQQSIVRGYHKATSSPRGNLYPQVLLACALAPVDELGYFSSADVRKPMSYIMKKLYDIPAFSRHLNDFCEEDRGPVLEKTGYPRRYKFRFKNPLMEPYVIMQGLSGELIKEEDLNKF